MTIEVPYDEGMDPYNGLLEVGVEMGLVEKRGARYSLTGEDKTWYGKDFGQYAEQILVAAEDNREKFLEGFVEDGEELGPDSKDSVKKQRKSNAEEK